MPLRGNEPGDRADDGAVLGDPIACPQTPDGFGGYARRIELVEAYTVPDDLHLVRERHDC